MPLRDLEQGIPASLISESSEMYKPGVQEGLLATVSLVRAIQKEKAGTWEVGSVDLSID